MTMNETKYHCQICEREIKAKNGVIAHHGYRRPWEGFQTSSCLGARFPSYEASRDRIPYVVKLYTEAAERSEAAAAALIAEPPATLTRSTSLSFKPEVVIERPENFDAKAALSRGSYAYNSYEYAFHRQYEHHAKSAKELRAAVARLEERFEEWGQQ